MIGFLCIERAIALPIKLWIGSTWNGKIEILFSIKKCMEYQAGFEPGPIGLTEYESNEYIRPETVCTKSMERIAIGISQQS